MIKIHEHDHEIDLDHDSRRPESSRKGKHGSRSKDAIDCATVCHCAESESEEDAGLEALAKAERLLREKRIKEHRDKCDREQKRESEEMYGEESVLSPAERGRLALLQKGIKAPRRIRKGYGGYGSDDDDYVGL